MSQESSSPPIVLLRLRRMDLSGRLRPEFHPRKAARPGGSREGGFRTNCGKPRTNCVRERDLSLSSLSPFLRGEGWGEGQTREQCELLDLYPLTRIASDDAIRPLPAGGER